MKAEIIKVAKTVSHEVSKKSPLILTAMAIGGVGLIVVSTRTATIRALEIENEYTGTYGIESDELEPKVRFQLTWKCYIPVIFTAGATVACIIFAQSINSKRQAALAGLYSISEASLKKYKEKVKEAVGENKSKKIEDDIAKDTIEEHPVDVNDIIKTGKGNYLFYDAMSGRYFRSDIETIRRIENDINHELISEMWVSLNEVYGKMGLKPIELGENVGWNVDHMIEFQFSSQIAKNGEPCIVIDYYRGPDDLYRDSIR